MVSALFAPPLQPLCTPPALPLFTAAEPQFGDPILCSLDALEPDEATTHEQMAAGDAPPRRRRRPVWNSFGRLTELSLAGYALVQVRLLLTASGWF